MLGVGSDEPVPPSPVPIKGSKMTGQNLFFLFFFVKILIITKKVLPNISLLTNSFPFPNYKMIQLLNFLSILFFSECTRSGFCNFMHLKPISRELRRELYGRKRRGRR